MARTIPRLLAPVFAAALLLTATGCEETEQPTAAEWRAEWRETADAVPSQAELGEPSEDVCNDVLGEIRESRSELRPAPDEVVDSAADAWFTYAEHVFFTCFEDVGSDQPVETAYDTLERLRNGVESALDTAAQP